MSGFGGFAPLPLRLGGSATEGLTAAQHARLSADVVACTRTAPIACITFSKSGATITILSYNGVDGIRTTDYPFTTASLATGVIRWTFDTVIEDEYGIAEPLVFRHGVGGVMSSSAGRAKVLPNGRNDFLSYTHDGSGALADLSATIILA